MPDDKPIDRRRFFREGLRELLKPLAKAAEPLERVAHELGKLDTPEGTAARGPNSWSEPVERLPDHWLRPPGALDERAFRDTCSRCSACVNVCPAQCIKLDYNGLRGAGAPYIEPNAMPCVLCTGLMCMQSCPTHALVPTPLEEIRMGVAEWRESLCVRPHGRDCTICVDHCPVGEKAIALIDGKIVVKDPGCTGCGVCQHECPTTPKSIVVIPASERQGGLD